MIITRNGCTPSIDPSAKISESAQIIGNVTIGKGSFVDHNVVIESSGPPVHLGERVLVFASSVIRSVGGSARPAFPVELGDETLVAPLCALTGCAIGSLCYVATGVIVLQGASLGEGSRVGVGAIVHAGARLPAGARVGMRHFAVPAGEGALITADVQEARERIRDSDFFELAFGVEQDTLSLHREIVRKLLAEVGEWSDQPIPPR